MSISADRVVYVHYTLTGEGGHVLDNTLDRGPAIYLHGHQNIVPGLEKALEGREVGDRFQVVVPPEDGYGPKLENTVYGVPRKSLPAGIGAVPGMQFMARGADGKETPVWIVEVQKEVIYVDFNHPLAGQTLFFEVEVLDVRDAEYQEILEGLPREVSDKGE